MAGHEGATYAAVFETAGKVIWAVTAIAAIFTAFYMWRLVFLTFFSGRLRARPEVADHVHESPFTMWFPLVVLAGLTVGAFAIAVFVGVVAGLVEAGERLKEMAALPLVS